MIWRRWNEGLLEASPAALADKTILYNDLWGRLLILAPLDMAIQAIYPSAGYNASMSVGATGLIYGPGGDGRDFAALKWNVPLAKTPWPKFRGNGRNTGRLER